jgi:hypothetical protein
VKIIKEGVIIVRKLITILYLTIFITSIASSLIAGAQENATINNTNSTTTKLIATESNVKESPTKTLVETKEQVFRIGPTVSLRPLNSEINKSQDGIVELFLNNPSLNDCPLEVDMVISVPSDIYINAQDGGMSGGAGTVTGHFSVPPGSSRTITLHIKGEKVGTFPVHFGGNYWPGTNKDQWNPINLDNSFEVKVPSDNPGPIPEPSIHGIPGLGVSSLIFILMMVFILRRS